MPNLLILPPTDEFTDRCAAAVSASVPELCVQIARDRETALRLLPDCVAAFGTLDTEMLSVAEKLVWLQAPMAAPPAGYFFDELIAHPVKVTNFRGIYNDHVATHAVAMLLTMARNLLTYTHQQARHEWTRHLADEDILHFPDSMITIVGVGGIGAEIGRMISAFRANVVGVDPQLKNAPEGFVTVVPPEELDSVLSLSDAVILTLPHTPESEGLMNASRLALMKPSAFLVNIGRGATVHLDAVVDALRDGKLGGVALDVFEEEPLPPDHPLWDEPRALLTPHVGVVGPHIPERRLEVLVENARRFVANRELINEVNKALWY